MRMYMYIEVTVRMYIYIKEVRMYLEEKERLL